MLTRAQIQRLAQRHSIGLQAQERDYIQHLLLFLLFSKSDALIPFRIFTGIPFPTCPVDNLHERQASIC